MQEDLLRNFLVIRGKGLRYIFRFSFIILCKILIYLCYSIACFSINSSVNIVLSGSNRSSITGSTQILYIFIFSAKINQISRKPVSKGNSRVYTGKDGDFTTNLLLFKSLAIMNM